MLVLSALIGTHKILGAYHYKSIQLLPSQKLLSAYHHKKYSAFPTTKFAQRLSSQRNIQRLHAHPRLSSVIHNQIVGEFSISTNCLLSQQSFGDI